MKRMAVAIMLLLICVPFWGCKRSDLIVGMSGNEVRHEPFSVEISDKITRDSNADFKFVYYSDVSYIGEIVDSSAVRSFHNQINNENYASEYAAGNYLDGNSFDFKDDNDFYVWVLFRKNVESADEYEDKLYEMPEVSDFRTEPEYNYPEDDTGPSLLGWRWFDYNGIVFCYDNGILRSVRWKYREYEVLVSALIQDDKLEKYPSYGKNTYFSRLINPETTQQAVQKLNNTMLWVFYIRPVLVRVVLPVISIVAAVGTVYLIIYKKRKKAASKSTVQETE